MPSGSNARAQVDVAVADHEIGATFDVLPTPTGQTWVIGRLVDRNNHIRAGLNNGSWQIQEVIAGAATTLTSMYSAATTAFAPPANGDRIRLICDGAAISLYVNERLIAVGTATTLLTGTADGVQTNNLTTRFANAA